MTVKRIELWAGANGVASGGVIVTLVPGGAEWYLHVEVKEGGVVKFGAWFDSMKSRRKQSSYRRDLTPLKDAVLAHFKAVEPTLDFAKATEQKLILDVSNAAREVSQLRESLAKAQEKLTAAEAALRNILSATSV